MPSSTGLSLRRRQRAAFTLIELIAVMVIVGTLAITAAPALSTFAKIRNTGLVNEIDRRLSLARAWASSTGQPAGVKFDVTNQKLSLVRIASSGASATALPAAGGAAESASSDQIAVISPGASLSSATFSPSGYDTIWFDYTGTPHVRNGSGTFVSNLTTDATITVGGGRTLTLRRVTGEVEK